jgi:hypothetical protein
LARHRATTRSSAGGSHGARLDGGGAGVASCAAIISARPVAANGVRPVTIWNSAQPSA